MAKKYEFRVVVDGIDLGAEAQERLDGAVAKAALQELAGLDLGGDLVTRRAMSGGLRGRQFLVLSGDEAEALGLQE